MLDNHRAARFHDPPERHAGWAGGFAGTALQAQVEMAHKRWRRVDPAIRERLKQMDASSRRVCLHAELEVGRALL